MRYDDWDVILFPKDSHVPLQEFKTACYVSANEGKYYRPLHPVSNSLPPSTPFRISIHSWATAARPSAAIEVQRKHSQKVVYTVQVVVDGARVFHGFFDIASKWPQEIAHEKRSLASVEQPTSQKRPCLEFPPFSLQTLMQTSWDARDNSSRIKIMLSEQLIGKPASPGQLDLGGANNIVCFSFQHAPRDVLEQSGISWPIRNPLYLPNAYEELRLPQQTSPKSLCAPKLRHPASDANMQSPLSHRSKTTNNRFENQDPHGRIRSHPRPPTLANSTRGNERSKIWEDAFADDGDDFTMGMWATERAGSSLTADVAMPDYMFTASHALKKSSQWRNASPVYEQSTNIARAGHRSKKETEKSQVVSVREDQLGHMIQALSPPRKIREMTFNFGTQHNEPMARPPTAHAYYPPRMGNAPIMTRPSSASMARKSSYPDFNSALRNVSTKAMKGQSFPAYSPSVSSNKDNHPHSQARIPTPFAWANQVPTPSPFAQRLPIFEPDPPVRDSNSIFPAQSRFDHASTMPPADMGKIASAHGPSAVSDMRSKKEGTGTNPSQLPQQVVRQEQIPLPPINGASTLAQQPSSKDHSKQTHSTRDNIPALVEVIDVDAIDPQLDAHVAGDAAKLTPHKSTHRQAMSSIDSTGRLEQQLFSALGEELGSFEETIDSNGMGPELARAIGGSATHSDVSGTTLLNPSASEFEPTTKRKRQGTLDGDRDRSPLTKREKAVLIETEKVGGNVVPTLRGD
ncbi:hypothetical protein T440DRAFT_482213 [Plenodomus tracheiphilus IPT5]|uniref:Uncharacterized protein n=1 Tax=Plenodomus tracheiphilus IPT5 TaxID=1408161 RepID=A0A6A7AUM0_9PLEO|nr:hypothetical protein T440DRAFT_482213 [Plenodomus tracheiphilus IPT5]